jgi:Ca-activated chloride channel homolog
VRAVKERWATGGRNVWERRLSMAALKCPSVVHFVSSFMAVLLCPIALAQSTERAPQFLVKLNVIVTDKSDRPAMDLNQEDFLVFDEGKQQALSFFQKKDIPISYGLIIDHTGSMRSTQDYVIQVAKAVVSSNGPEDQTFILRLIHGEDLLAVDWTSDKTALLNRLSLMKGAGGIGSIIDTTSLCSAYIAKHLGSEDTASRRRAIILITDGIEKNSSKKMDELIKRLHKDNVQVFSIGIISTNDVPAGIFGKSIKERATDFLDRLVEETGGRSFYPKSESDLGHVAGLVTSYMRSQYVIGYTATGTAGKDGYNKVRVRLVDESSLKKLTATARLRYLASDKL